MPGRDATGPRGMGPGTGRGMGLCRVSKSNKSSSGLGLGLRRGFCGGMRGKCGANVKSTDTKTYLSAQKAELENRLRQIDEELQSL